MIRISKGVITRREESNDILITSKEVLSITEGLDYFHYSIQHMFKNNCLNRKKTCHMLFMIYEIRWKKKIFNRRPKNRPTFWRAVTKFFWLTAKNLAVFLTVHLVKQKWGLNQKTQFFSLQQLVTRNYLKKN
ncbi:hypothetical protein BpHYR1_021796 [Brachionus plicatilis]|uniref:Uncharacterized protein n=1 Tax=Brachionus plicatilis TaxID=10195 RepID=A0A3M7RMP9_BRAPC|nr:hypothetical protein BpHYR1_021796 [Brachionus plicatilis]